MPECKYCEQHFDAEQDLRHHLYWDHERDTLGRIDRKRVEQFLADAQSGAGSPVDVDCFEAFLSNDDSELMFDALREFSTWLNRTHSYDGKDASQELFWDYYARVANQCDTVVQRNGWNVLSTVINEFEPRSHQQWPLITPIVANVTGRFIIRTHSSEGVNTIPNVALAYLGELPHYTGPMAGEVHEEAAIYGWGIGHRSESVADTIYEVATADIQWAHSALFEAFWADQRKAVSLLERLTTSPEIPRPRFFIGCVGLVDDYAQTPKTSPSIHPRYWRRNSHFTGAFAWERSVGTRIQDLVSRLARESDTPSAWPDPETDWTFSDLRL